MFDIVIVNFSDRFLIFRHLTWKKILLENAKMFQSHVNDTLEAFDDFKNKQKSV